MTPEEFVKAYAEAFGSDTQLPIAFGYIDDLCFPSSTRKT